MDPSQQSAQLAQLQAHIQQLQSQSQPQTQAQPNAQPNPTWNPFQQQMQQPQPSQPLHAVMNTMLSWFMQAQANTQPPLQSSAPTAQQPTPAPQDNTATVQPLPFNDEDLAKVIAEKTTQGMTYKSAIESLHLHKGRQAYEWKDYYLENKIHIDNLVTKMKGRSNKNRQITHLDSVKEKARATSSSAQDSDDNTQPRSASEKTTHQRQVIKRTKKRRFPSRSPQREGTSTSRRKTMNSMSTFPKHDILALIPADVPVDPETNLPAVPSRPPTPPEPSSIKPGGKGNLYTDRDARFFLRFLAWKLAQDPDCSKAEIAEELGRQAPHHPASSWQTYWGRHQQVADRLLLLAKLDEQDKGEAIRRWSSNDDTQSFNFSHDRQSSEKGKASNRSPSREGVSSDSEPDRPQSRNGLSESESEEEAYDTDPIDDSEPGEFEAGLGNTGDPFGIAEIRVLAKHISRTQNWHSLRGQERYGPFQAKHPQRTFPAWREFYRRRQKDVDRMTRKYKKRDEAKQTIKTQRGRPSWAKRSGPSMKTDDS